jgi:hypothetical protein
MTDTICGLITAQSANAKICLTAIVAIDYSNDGRVYTCISVTCTPEGSVLNAANVEFSSELKPFSCGVSNSVVQ